MSGLAIDLQAMRIEENMRNLKMTVLHRPGGQWYPSEISKFVNGLMTEASQHPKFPEYVILWGHHTKAATLEALGGGMAYTATLITGLGHKDLPFRPGFI